SARALRDHHRNLTDDQIRAVAATGGVVCVNFLPAFLTEDVTEYTVDRLVDHIEHVVSVGGIDHVGLGPDFIREVMHDVTPPCCEEPGYSGVDIGATLPGLSGPSGLPLVTDALLKHGFADEEIVKIIGGNVHRLFRAELGRPA
ncbi:MULTISPECIES: dipeptidase, partial [unclassified Streptosporangium]|uniref:dipeptidase n=1 Tax=Streptosporangium sp. NPDC005286 TaxID=3154463 RepID=UPI0033A7810D